MHQISAQFATLLLHLGVAWVYIPAGHEEQYCYDW